MDKYIFENGIVRLEPDLLVWALWFESHERRLLRSIVGRSRVSTVFLGMDHRYDEGTPLLFETMIFGHIETLNERCWRYETALLARRHHEVVVEMLKELCQQEPYVKTTEFQTGELLPNYK